MERPLWEMVLQFHLTCCLRARQEQDGTVPESMGHRANFFLMLRESKDTVVRLCEYMRVAAQNSAPGGPRVQKRLVVCAF